MPITLVVVSCLPHVRLTSTPTSQTILSGGTTGYNILASKECGLTGNVTLTATGSASGITTTIGTPTTLPLPWQTTTPVQVTSASSVPAGNYTVNIRADAVGADTNNYFYHIVNPQLVVAALSTRHNITAAPTSVSARVGESTTVTVTMTTSGGFRGPITFSTGLAPFDTGVQFSPATLDAAGTTTLTLTPGINAPPGTYSLPIVAAGSQGARTATISFTILPRAAIIGRVTNSAGAGIAGARVEWIRNGVSGGSVIADSNGSYLSPDLPWDSYALFCSAAGYKTAIFSPLSTQPVASVTKDFVLPVLPAAPAAKEYIYVQNRLVAIDSASGGTPFIDFENYTGANEGFLPLPPLVTGGATFTGGQLFPITTFLPANLTVVYGTGGFEWCIGCATIIRITFDQPVRSAAVTVHNGQTFPIDYTLTDSTGASRAAQIPANFNSGTARFSLTGSSISWVEITSTLTAGWDFFLDEIAYVPMPASAQSPVLLGSPQAGARSRIDVAIKSKPVPTPANPRAVRGGR